MIKNISIGGDITMRRNDKGLKIQYKVGEKFLSLRFKTIEDFLKKDFSQNNNPMAATNDTKLSDVRWNKQSIDNCIDHKISEVKDLLKNFNPNDIIRKEIYSIEEIREKTKNVLFEPNKRLAQINLDGDLVKGNSQRYQTFFTKGCKCAVCGIEGKYFAKEKYLKHKSYHLNLYAVDNNGNEILMTKDHIIPRSKGGIDDVSNYQTMCKLCNEAKGNN